MKTLSDKMKLKNSRQGFIEDVADALAIIPGQTHRMVRSKLLRTSLLATIRELTPLHHEILHLLATQGKTNQAEVGRRLQVAKAQITTLVNKLANLGIIERKIDPTDKRVYNLVLTEKGKRFTRKLRKLFFNSIDALTISFSEEELQEFAVSLRTVQEMLYRMELVESRRSRKSDKKAYV